jgi:bifunctional pyridoxal-dependent enzyme with beta-cystathionase and maltose regulon repressor activities
MNRCNTRFWQRQRAEPQVAEAQLKAEKVRLRTSFIKWHLARLKVHLAFLTNNRHGKREDNYGRTYRFVCRKFGMTAMIAEYIQGNSWSIK